MKSEVITEELNEARNTKDLKTEALYGANQMKQHRDTRRPQSPWLAPPRYFSLPAPFMSL